jgi:hypothetical protein
MTHDEQAKYFIKQGANQAPCALETDQAALSLLASIAHSLVAMNEKIQLVMDEDFDNYQAGRKS